MSSENGASSGATLRVGIIGAGKPWKTEGSTGFGMSRAHADGYNCLPQCRIVAVCDLIRERAEEFNETKVGGQAEIYQDYPTMLSEASLDMVSVCTWPDLHAPVVLAAAAAGVRAIHCEKPMAATWGEARQMEQTCRERGVQLTFNHQRRFLDTFQAARRLLKEGTIGELKRIEGSCGDLSDWGTHWLDMFGFYNDEVPGEWVMAQVDVRRPRLVFGVPVESQGICCIRYRNGVHALLYTGEEAAEIVGCANRLIGTEGVIEVHSEAPNVRYRTSQDNKWQTVETTEGLHDGVANIRSVGDAVAALVEGRRPLHSSAHAIQSTEIIFAAYESARRRGRIDLPLTGVEDSPLRAMIA
ncbi:MAG: Gfo/Idh/MocA family oxidoreductase, partial [Cytophagales bacterium]|nr:Gfo/Idh/MocA family oxidoreductase [Armatimonadota bacterium]